jgi:hypothetical protein
MTVIKLIVVGGVLYACVKVFIKRRSTQNVAWLMDEASRNGRPRKPENGGTTAGENHLNPRTPQPLHYRQGLEISPSGTVALDLSHELRTPMNIVLGYARLLQDKSDLPVDVLEGLRTIESSGRQLLRVVNEILGISRQGALEADAIREPEQAFPDVDNFDPAESDDETESIDFPRVHFPNDLLLELMDATILGHRPTLEALIIEVRHLGGEAAHLADILLRLTRALDMVAIQELLEEIHLYHESN